MSRKELTAPAKGNQGEKDQGLRSPHGGRGPQRQPRRAQRSEQPVPASSERAGSAGAALGV